MTDQELAIKAFWEDFLAFTHPNDPSPERYTAWSFGRSKAAADELGKLVREGKKTATASLVWVYEAEQEPLPRIGDFSLILDGHGNPLCIIRTTQIEILPFDEVGAEHARLEGEGDLSLNFWREVHWRFFGEECAEIGREPDAKMLVCCERFSLCYPVKNKS